MKPRNGVLILATVATALCVGCSQEETGNYRAYSTDRTPIKSAVPAPVEKPRVADVPPTTDRNVAELLPAAVGFFGGQVLADVLARLGGDRWITPAVGTGPALALAPPDPLPSGQRSLPVITPDGLKPTTPLVPKVLIKERAFRTEGPEGALRITYDDLDLLKVLNMEPVTADAPKLMPDWLKGLHGKKVRIRGFMSPAFKQTGLTNFLMGRDNKCCLFPGQAKVYSLFKVKLRKGVTSKYIYLRPFDVVGTFYVRPWVVEGDVLAIYRIEDAVIVK